MKDEALERALDEAYEYVKYGSYYLLCKDERHKYRVTHYIGPANEWKEYKLAPGTKLAALLDLVLYLDEEERRELIGKLHKSSFQPRGFLWGFDTMDGRVVEREAHAVVGILWSGHHHWGHLIDEEVMSTREFVVDYLFRFVNVLASSELTSPIDAHDYIRGRGSASDVSYSLSEVWDYFKNYKYEDGRKLDEFLIDVGIDELGGLPTEEELGRMMDEGVGIPGNAVRIVERVIKDIIVHDFEDLGHDWSLTLDLADDLSRNLIYGPFGKVPFRQFDEVKTPNSLADLVFHPDRLGMGLAESIGDFIYKAERI